MGEDMQSKEPKYEKQSVIQKIESFALLVVVTVTSLYYMFWLVLFFIGSTHIPRH
jgi:hypothetical protein